MLKKVSIIDLKLPNITRHRAYVINFNYAVKKIRQFCDNQFEIENNNHEHTMRTNVLLFF